MSLLEVVWCLLLLCFVGALPLPWPRGAVLAGDGITVTNAAQIELMESMVFTKGPGYGRKRAREARRRQEEEEEPPPPPLGPEPEREETDSPPPKCFLHACATVPVWAITGRHDEAPLALVTCHQHTLELMASADVNVESVAWTGPG